MNKWKTENYQLEMFYQGKWISGLKTSEINNCYHYIQLYKSEFPEAKFRILKVVEDFEFIEEL